MATPSMMKPAGLVLALGAGLALAACSTPAPTGTSLDRFRLEAVEQTEVLELAPTGAGLSGLDRGRRSAFLSAYGQTAGGPLVITVPVGGADAGAAAQLAGEAEAFAAGFGVSGSRIARGQYQAGPDESAPVILAYSRYAAVAPDCPTAAGINYVRSHKNVAPENFGCAVMTNLAQMVAYPGDLAATRPLDPADAARRAVVLEKYRAGENTATERSEQESGAVSTAVE